MCTHDWHPMIIEEQVGDVNNLQEKKVIGPIQRIQVVKWVYCKKCLRTSRLYNIPLEGTNTSDIKDYVKAHHLEDNGK